MNLLLVVVDALRADRFGLHGSERDTTPFLDELAADGRWYPNFFTSANSTFPALASLFSGTSPFRHGVYSRRGERIRPGVFDLASVLRRAGYRAGALDNLVREHGWLGPGFRDRIDLRRPGAVYNETHEFVDATCDWLSSVGEEPFFFYVRLCSTHTPYKAPADLRGRYYRGDPTTTNVGSLDGLRRDPVRKRQVLRWLEEAGQAWPAASGTRIEDIDWVRAQYDACVRDADDGLRGIHEHLQKSGLADDTLTVVLGDHGESLGEHGITCDHHGLYDVSLRTPLVFHGPGVPPGCERGVARTADVAATILDLLDLRSDEHAIGRSLLSTPRSPDDAVLTSEASWMFKHSLRTSQWKYILSLAEDAFGFPAEELYDLAADPGEKKNLAESLPLQARQLRHQLEAAVREECTAGGLEEDPVAQLAGENAGRLFAPVEPLAPASRVRRVLRRVGAGLRG